MLDPDIEKAKLSHERYPDSIAYSDWKNKTYSIEQRNLEFRLEELTNKCLSLIKEQANQAETQGKISNIPPVVLPDLKRFRGDREYCLRALSQVSFPKPPLIQTDLFDEEIEAAKIPHISLNNIHSLLIQYFQSRKYQLIQRKCNYLSRWSRFCAPNSNTRSTFPSFSLRLERFDTEYEDTLLRLERLEGGLSRRYYHPIQPPSSLLEHNTAQKGRRFDLKGATQANKGKDMIAEPTSDVWLGSRTLCDLGDSFVGLIQPDDLRICLRETVFSAHVSKRLNLFLSELRLLSFSHRIQIARRSISILNQPKQLSRNSPAGNTIPLLVSDQHTLDVILFQLGHYFGIANAPSDVVQSEGFTFKSARFFTDYMAKHKKKSDTPLYSQCSLFDPLSSALPIQETTTDADDEEGFSEGSVPNRGQIDQKSRAGHASNYGLDYTFVKASPWAPYSAKPVVAEWQEEQEEKLGREAIDGLLMVEMEVLKTTEIDVLLSRSRTLATTHTQRIQTSQQTAGNDDETRFGQTPTVGRSIEENLNLLEKQNLMTDTASQAMVHSLNGISDLIDSSRDKQPLNKGASQKQSLPKRKLIALYLLKHVRCVELRQRLLEHLNYFVSIQRKLTLDALGFPWESESKNVKSSKPKNPVDEFDFDENTENEETPLIQTPLYLTKDNTKVLPTSAAFSLFTIPEPTAFGFNRSTFGSNEQSSHTTSTSSSSQHKLPRTFEVCPHLTIYQMRQLKGLTHRDDEWIIGDDDTITIKDSHGVSIVYEMTMSMLEHLESELLRIASHYLSASIAQRVEEATMRMELLSDSARETGEIEQLSQHMKDQILGEATSQYDRQTLLADILECEALYQRSKRKLIDLYIEAYENTVDPTEMRELNRVITCLLALRPRLDLTGHSFVDSYASEIICLELQYNLMHAIMSRMVNEERSMVRQVSSAFTNLSVNNTLGLPHPLLDVATLPEITLVPRGHLFMPFEFVSSLSQIRYVSVVMDSVLKELIAVHRPTSQVGVSALHCALLQQAILSWIEMEKLDEQETLFQASLTPMSQATLGGDDPGLEPPEEGLKTREEIEDGLFASELFENPVSMCSAVDEFLQTLEEASDQTQKQTTTIDSETLAKVEELGLGDGGETPSQLVNAPDQFESHPTEKQAVTKAARDPYLQLLKTKLASIFGEDEFLTGTQTSPQTVLSTEIFESDTILTQGALASIVAYTQTLEAVRLRQEMILEHHQVEVLFGIYRDQAESVGLRVRRFELAPFKFNEATGEISIHGPSQEGLKISEDGLVTKGDETDQEGEEPEKLAQTNTPEEEKQDDPENRTFTPVKVCFAMAEFDQHLIDFNFHTSTGIFKVIGEAGLNELRKSYSLELMQKNLLFVVVRYNQLSIDKYLRELKYLERTIASITLHEGARPLSDKDTVFMTSVEGQEETQLELSSDASPELIMFNDLKRKALRRWKKEALRDVASHFVPLNARKISLRELRMKGYSERSVNILKREKKGEISKKLYRLKLDMIDGYCSDMTKDVTIYSLRIQHAQVLSEIRDDLRRSPNTSPFIVSNMNNTTASINELVSTLNKYALNPEEMKKDLVTVKKKEGKAQVSTPFENLITTGTLMNLWYVPDEQELMNVSEDVAGLVNMRVAVGLLIVLQDLHSYAAALFCIANPDFIEKQNNQRDRQEKMDKRARLAKEMKIELKTKEEAPQKKEQPPPSELDTIKLQMEGLPFAGDPFLVFSYLTDVRTRYDLFFRILYSSLEEAFLSKQNQAFAGYLRRQILRFSRIFNPPAVFKSPLVNQFSQNEFTQHFFSQAITRPQKTRGVIAKNEVFSGPYGQMLSRQYPTMFGPNGAFIEDDGLARAMISPGNGDEALRKENLYQPNDIVINGAAHVLPSPYAEAFERLRAERLQLQEKQSSRQTSRPVTGSNSKSKARLKKVETKASTEDDVEVGTMRRVLKDMVSSQQRQIQHLLRSGAVHNPSAALSIASIANGLKKGGDSIIDKNIEHLSTFLPTPTCPPFLSPEYQVHVATCPPWGTPVTDSGSVAMNSNMQSGGGMTEMLSLNSGGSDGLVLVGRGALGSGGIGRCGVNVWGYSINTSEMVGEGGGGVFLSIIPIASLNPQTKPSSAEEAALLEQKTSTKNTVTMATGTNSFPILSAIRHAAVNGQTEWEYAGITFSTAGSSGTSQKRADFMAEDEEWYGPYGRFTGGPYSLLTVGLAGQLNESLGLTSYHALNAPLYSKFNKSHVVPNNPFPKTLTLLPSFISTSALPKHFAIGVPDVTFTTQVKTLPDARVLDKIKRRIGIVSPHLAFSNVKVVAKKTKEETEGDEENPETPDDSLANVGALGIAYRRILASVATKKNRHQVNDDEDGYGMALGGSFDDGGIHHAYFGGDSLGTFPSAHVGQERSLVRSNQMQFHPFMTDAIVDTSAVIITSKQASDTKQSGITMPSTLISSQILTQTSPSTSSPIELAPSPTVSPSNIPPFLYSSLPSSSRLSTLYSFFSGIPKADKKTVLQECLMLDISISSALDEAGLMKFVSGAGSGLASSTAALEMLHVSIQYFVDYLALIQLKRVFLCRILGINDIRTNDTYAIAQKVYSEIVLTPLAMQWFSQQAMKAVGIDAKPTATKSPTSTTNRDKEENVTTKPNALVSTTPNYVSYTQIPLPLRSKSGIELKLSSSVDLRPEGVSQREWMLMQLSFLRKELDKLLLRDAISLVELNYQILTSEIEEEAHRAEVEARRIAPNTQLQLEQLKTGNSLILLDLNPETIKSASQWIERELTSAEVAQISQGDNSKPLVVRLPSGNQLLVNRLQDEVSWNEKTKTLGNTLGLLSKRGVNVTTDNDTTGILFTKALYHQAVGELAQRISVYGEERNRQNHVSTQLIAEALQQRLNASQRRERLLLREQTVHGQMIRRRVQAEVSEKASNFVFEIERLRTIVGKMQRAMDLQEDTIRLKVNEEYETLVTGLRAQLMEAEGNFRKYKGEMQNNVVLSLHKLTSENLQKIDEAQTTAPATNVPAVTAGYPGFAPGSASTTIRERTTNTFSQIKSRYGGRDQTRDVISLRQQKADLEKQIASLDTESKVSQYEMKRLLLAKVNDLQSQLEDLQEQHFDDVQERDGQIRMLELRLEQTSSKLDDTISKLETIEVEYDQQAKNKVALMQWKAHNSRVIKQLQEQLAKYKRWNNIDIDKLFIDLERKENELQLAEAAEEKAQRNMEQMDELHRREYKRLQRVAQNEKTMKENAFNKLDELRRWMETTGYTPPDFMNDDLEIVDEDTAAGGASPTRGARTTSRNATTRPGSRTTHSRVGSAGGDVNYRSFSATNTQDDITSVQVSPMGTYKQARESPSLRRPHSVRGDSFSDEGAQASFSEDVMFWKRQFEQMKERNGLLEKENSALRRQMDVDDKVDDGAISDRPIPSSVKRQERYSERSTSSGQATDTPSTIVSHAITPKTHTQIVPTQAPPPPVSHQRALTPVQKSKLMIGQRPGVFSTTSTSKRAAPLSLPRIKCHQGSSKLESSLETIIATRMVLQQLKGKLVAAQKGHDLLKRKSDALSVKFRDILSRIIDVKTQVVQYVEESMFATTQVKYAAGDQIKYSVMESVNSETNTLTTMRMENIAGVLLPVFDLHTEGHNTQEYTGLAKGGERVAECREVNFRLLEALTRLASLQTAFSALDEVIKVTNRRVNALEYVVIPQVEENIHYVESEMSEMEREEFFRLKKVQKSKKVKSAAADEARAMSKLEAANDNLVQDDEDDIVV
ncbi:putative V-type proton ATPase subunit D [Blattamonas nauphoetae]|uniref:V-type proton ATPase subunit D n=1 Tax=Blattamonas nauphoetae TaxID=2049346 RepID=A0ABQ9Y435_9EUKA|nr:putative V-type proton ATPase subunit D [Blattamonas nauphoetae]